MKQIPSGKAIVTANQEISFILLTPNFYRRQYFHQ